MMLYRLSLLVVDMIKPVLHTVGHVKHTNRLKIYTYLIFFAWQEWEKKHGLYSKPLAEMLRREVQTWGIVQPVQFWSLI